MANFHRPIDDINAEENARVAIYKQRRLREHKTMEDDIYRKRYEYLYNSSRKPNVWLSLGSYALGLIAFVLILLML